MYAKLEKNKLIYAPKNLKVGDKLILNFNKNVELMKNHGFKELVDNKPEYDSSTHYLSKGEYKEDEHYIYTTYELKEIISDPEPSLEERISELEEMITNHQKLVQELMLMREG